MSPARTEGASRRISVAAAAVVITTLAASAGATVTGEPVRPSLASMPDTTFPAALDAIAAPSAVDAAERVDGLTVDGVPGFRSGQRVAVLSSSDRRCLTAGFLSPSDGANPTHDGEVSHTLTQHAVAALRSERLVIASDGGASLEIIDAWVDPGTRGAQLAAKTSVALTKLASGPEGFAVYGLRRGDALELVVPTPQHMSSRDAEGTLLSTSCDHVRLELRAEVGVGASVIVAGLIPTSPDVAAADAIQQLSAPKPTRMIQVSASASRTSRDPAPVLSVAISWAEEAPEPRGGARPAQPRQFEDNE